MAAKDGTMFLKTPYVRISAFYNGRVCGGHARDIFSFKYLLYFIMVCFTGNFP